MSLSAMSCASRGCMPGMGSPTCCTGSDLHVRPGECVTLLGRNGAGQTTTLLRAVMGLSGRRTGSILLNGRETIGLAAAPHRAAWRRVLPGGARHLLEPLLRGEPPAASGDGPGGTTVDAALRHVPEPAERRHSQGTRLSGGEQQMLAHRAHPARGRAPAAAGRNLPKGWPR